MTQFQEMLSRTLKWEGYGALTDIPGDKGGKTKWGVTKLLAQKYGYDVALLTRPEAERVYRLEFYEKLPLVGEWENFLPDIRVKWILFDIAVNSGVRRAVKTLQKAIGQAPTGDWTSAATTSRINQLTAAPDWAESMIGALCQERKFWYTYLAADEGEHDVDEKFLKGWLRRAADRGDGLVERISEEGA